MNIVVYTCHYGAHDEPIFYPGPTEWQGHDVVPVYITDLPVHREGWNVVQHSRQWMAPRLASKIPKILPHLFFPEADVAIWIDSSMQLKDGWLDYAMAHFDIDAPFPFLVHRHRAWNSLSAEYERAVQLPKYMQQPLRSQYETYRSVEGLQDDYGFWENGFIVRANHHDKVALFDLVWLGEVMRWTDECQLSMAYTLQTFGVRPLEFPDPMPSDNAEGPMFTIRTHTVGPGH